jgi:hypothetical protein
MGAASSQIATASSSGVLSLIDAITFTASWRFHLMVILMAQLSPELTAPPPAPVDPFTASQQC